MGPAAAARTTMRDATAGRSRSFFLLSGILLGVTVLAASQRETPQVILLIPLEHVVLVSPSRPSATEIEPIGELVAGQSVPVLSCSPRKRHTEIEVSFQGRAAIVWKGNYRLERRAARDGESNATSSCNGLASP
jgi:hypothetical protein